MSPTTLLLLNGRDALATRDDAAPTTGTLRARCPRERLALAVGWRHAAATNCSLPRATRVDKQNFGNANLDHRAEQLVAGSW